MRRLFPVTDEVTDETALTADGGWSLDALADAYAYPQDQVVQAARHQGAPAHPQGRKDAQAHPQGRKDAPAHPQGHDASAATHPHGPKVWLRANMVSSLDGAAQHDGRSRPISSETDMRIFGTLRALADVVVVGAETVRLEGYRPARARDAFAARRKAAGQGPAPAIAVVSASLDLDFSLPLFVSPLVPTLVLTGATAPLDRIRAARAAGAEVLIAGDGGRVEPAKAVRALAERGLTRQLTEGGPRLLAQFVAAGVLDELCLTVSPMLTAGRAQRIADGPGPEVPDRFALASILEEDGFLYTRYRRDPAAK